MIRKQIHWWDGATVVGIGLGWLLMSPLHVSAVWIVLLFAMLIGLELLVVWATHRLTRRYFANNLTWGVVLVSLPAMAAFGWSGAAQRLVAAGCLLVFGLRLALTFKFPIKGANPDDQLIERGLIIVPMVVYLSILLGW